jgi:hypothetical protein
MKQTQDLNPFEILNGDKQVEYQILLEGPNKNLMSKKV